MERLTRLMIRYRWAVVTVWLVVLLGGGYASTKLSGLLANTFTVPGTDSERVRTVLSSDFGDRSDGSFTVVFQTPNAEDLGVRSGLQARLDEAARVVPSGQAHELRVAGPHLLYGDVTSTLKLSDAKGYTDDLLNAVGKPPAGRAYVTGAAAIQHDLDPIFNSDLARGESIALPIALLVLLAVFGLSWGITIPFLFAGSTIMGTLGIVYLLAHELTMATYVTNLVQLIGLGIAIDYSLLIVYRFREELERPGSVDDAIVRTMATAGRAVIFSGATVAIGLALLLAMPIPFMRSMGVGGFLIPLVSIVAAADAAARAALALRTARRQAGARRGVDAKAAPRPAAFAPRHGRPRAWVLGAARALDHAPADPLSGAGKCAPDRRRRPRLRAAVDAWERRTGFRAIHRQYAVSTC